MADDLQDCEVCGGSGFSGYGSGYDPVCSNCGGSKQLPKKPQHWSVTVAVDGETVLTIESNCLSGISDIDQHSETIRTCARHLLGFVGDGA